MSDKTCTVQGCSREHLAKGLCGAHYRRVRRGNSLDSPVRPQGMTKRETLDWYSKPEGDCLVWTGPVDSNGYGALRAEGDSQVAAHRVAWEMVHGAIPEGVLLDHRCWNRRCVNIEHLRYATRTENGQYRSGASSTSKTGVRGVFLTDTGKYRAQYRNNGKKVSVGRFDTLEEAATAIEAARREAFGNFAGRGKAPGGDDA